MKFLIHLLAFIFFCIVSCGENLEVMENTDRTVQSTFEFGNQNFAFPSLSENAKVYTSQWGAYEDFAVEAKGINGSTLEGLRNTTERLISSIDSLTKKVPDTLQTQSIVSRIMVTKTRASLLHQEVNKARLDSSRMQAHINEMNMATMNLIIQINEKFQKDDIDFQRRDSEKQELEKQRTFLDSVYKSELQDKKI